MTTYTPKPIAVDGVELPPALTPLLETLAENAHEVWAAQRIKDGWTYGPARDDKAKSHPGLVPYAELSEGEKEYDRETSAKTLKAIVTLGYRIVPPA